MNTAIRWKWLKCLIKTFKWLFYTPSRWNSYMSYPSGSALELLRNFDVFDNVVILLKVILLSQNHSYKKNKENRFQKTRLQKTKTQTKTLGFLHLYQYHNCKIQTVLPFLNFYFKYSSHLVFKENSKSDRRRNWCFQEEIPVTPGILSVKQVFSSMKLFTLLTFRLSI